jgi:predicted transcriptional regulator
MKRAGRTKLSITVDPRLYQVVDRQAKKAKVSKSSIVEEAIRLWERQRLLALAKEGYQQMAAEDRADAKAYLPVLAEIGEEG